MLGVPVEIPQLQFLVKFDTPVLLARCRVLFDKVVDVPVVLCNGVLRVQKTVEVIQLVPQMRVEERNTEQVVDIPATHHGRNDGSGEMHLARSLCLALLSWC